MSLDEIKQSNFKLLDTLQGTEGVGIDSAGRLYVVEESALISSVQAFFSRSIIGGDIVALEYATQKFNDYEFQDISSNQTKYFQLQKKLSDLGITSVSNSAAISRVWYHKRIESLVNSGSPLPEATAMATCELWHDPYISVDFKQNVCPELTKGGTSGSYFIKNLNGEKIGVFKPQDEEIYMPNNPKGYAAKPGFTRCGPRRGHLQGTCWQKEIAAWEIDQGQLAHVPRTTSITLLFPERPQSKNIVSKQGSFQRFAQGVIVSELTKTEIEAIPVEEVQSNAMFDLIVGNGDRNTGNMLYDKKNKKLTPIDHGLILLDSIDWIENPHMSEISCQWLSWPQVKLPINDRIKNWVLHYNIDSKCQNLRSKGISAGSIRAHKLQVTFLKVAVQKGYTLEQIATRCMQTNSTKSDLTFLDQKRQQVAFSIPNGDFTNETVFIEQFKNLLEAEL